MCGPFVCGPSLQARIDEQGPLGVRDVVRIALQTARGLAAAHAQGLVHRALRATGSPAYRFDAGEMNLVFAAPQPAVRRQAPVAASL